MNEILRLQEWYSSQCDGNWEHKQGVTIVSCDNPGWWVKVDLAGTLLETKPFACVARNISPGKMDQVAGGLEPDMDDRGPDWMLCEVKDKVFDGAGDGSKLQLILRTFLDWAEEAQRSEPATPSCDDKPGN